MNVSAIYSRQTVTPEGIKDATIVISNGIITDIIHGRSSQFENNLVDCGNKVLMPGIIDPHVHINEPGRTDWEGFDTATRAALAGGITTLVDMPLNSSPVTTTVAAWEEKIKSAKQHLHANCGFWGGLVPGNEDEIVRLTAKGVMGFKAFLIHSGIDEFPNVTEEYLRKAMPVIVKNDMTLLVHCELENMKREASNGKRSYNDYLESRPREWEDKAIEMMISLCGEFDCRVHIVHLSSSNSIDRIAKAKEKGLPLSVETGQHYLYFSAEEIPEGQTQFKCAPPIREKENNEKLWQALKDGIIDFVATDHSPSPPGMKELQSGDFSKAWGGISSLQFALPALWTITKRNGGSLMDIVKWLSSGPAALLGKENIKGKIAPGYDADLVVWDPVKKFRVTEDIIQHKHKITPYLEEELWGLVEQTFLGGEKVYENGKFLHLNRGNIITHQ